jgi:hypothetical protein
MTGHTNGGARNPAVGRHTSLPSNIAAPCSNSVTDLLLPCHSAHHLPTHPCLQRRRTPPRCTVVPPATIRPAPHSELLYVRRRHPPMVLSPSHCCTGRPTTVVPTALLNQAPLTTLFHHYYVRNSNRRHGSEMRVKTIISDLEKQDMPTSPTSGIGSVEGKKEIICFLTRLS